MVIDASVTLSWCFRDEQSNYARRILSELPDERAVMPGIWLLEVANGFLIAERRGRLSEADVKEAHALLAAQPITFAEITLDEAFSAVLGVAREQNLSAYDAAYLALAMREGLPLATLDERLRAAATRVGAALA
jgi:predicted nucleic acid-binding protein